MKALKIVLIILGVIVLIAVVLGLTGPKNYQIERTAVISASPAVVWPYTSSGKAFQEWSPFRKMDTTAVVEYFGTEGAVGSGYKWEGKNSGKGDQTFTTLEPEKAAISHLKFYTPIGLVESDAYMNLEPDPAGTKVTWGIKGENKFLARIMHSMTDMEKQMGPVFEGGLNDLNALIATRASSVGSPYQIALTDFPGGTYIGVKQEIKMSDIVSFYEKNVPLAFEAVKKGNMQMMGALSGLYYSWDEPKGMTTVFAGLPVNADAKAPAGMEIVTLAPGKAAMVKYVGAYSGIDAAHVAMENYFKSNNLTETAPVIEEYVTGPADEPDSTKWVTKIIYPVK